MSLVCTTCGVLNGIPELDKEMWSIYHRLVSGKQNYEPLVFTGDWVQENIIDEEDHAGMMLAMERDMMNRGLCPTCGRPDLRGVKDDDIMSEEDAQDMYDMWAEQAAERRMGA